MPLPRDHSTRIARARLALAGLSLGDAFGEQFTFREAWARGPEFRQTPPAPWTWTDDTAQAMAVTEVLNRCGTVDQDALAEALARYFSRDSGRGYAPGMAATLQEILEGTPWREAAGIAFDGQGSYGNGGAMRVAPLAGYFAEDITAVAAHARKSAEVTHAHPEGIAGAIAVAVAGAWAWQRSERGRAQHPAMLFDVVLVHTPEGETKNGIAIARDVPFSMWEHDAANQLGNGARVTSADTVPFCLWAAARHLDDFVEALWTTVKVGGDVDTNAAIVGGIVALSVGPTGIPGEWLHSRESLH